MPEERDLAKTIFFSMILIFKNYVKISKIIAWTLGQTLFASIHSEFDQILQKFGRTSDPLSYLKHPNEF